MTEYLFAPRPVQSVPVKGESAAYPISRIFCVGRNYAAHAQELGNTVDRQAPMFFTKSPAAIVANRASAPYPPATSDFHHEVELVVAIGAPLFNADQDEARAAIYGYGAGLDMTRRDRQSEMRAKSYPWCIAKNIEFGAVFGPLTRASDFGEIGEQTITLAVDDERRQHGRLSEMIWPVDAILQDLSRLYHLAPGDVVMTGTPKGVGPVQPGQRLVGSIDGLEPVEVTVGPAA